MTSIIAWYRPLDPAGPPQRRWGEPRYVAYVLGRGSAGPLLEWVDLGEAAVVDRIVYEARSAFSDSRIDPRPAARALYRAVVAPLVPLIERPKARSVIISPDEMNQHIRTVIVAPMTTGGRPYPSRVPCAFQGKRGQVVLDQIRTVDKTRLVRRLGTISPRVQGKVLKTLQEMFAK